MSPEQQIKNLIYRYAELIDDGDLAGVAQLLGRARFLAPDGSEQGSGAEAIESLYRSFTRLYPDGTPLSHHVTTNVLVEVDGDAATALFSIVGAVILGGATIIAARPWEPPPGPLI